MLHPFKHYIKWLPSAALLVALLPACNKIPGVEDIPKPNPSGQTIAEIINTDPNYSLLKAAATKAGTLPLLGNPGGTLTLFAPDDAAFARSGINGDVINALPAAQLAAILQYHILPQTIPSAAIPDLPVPNVQYPTMLQPTAEPLFKLSSFPSKRGSAAYVNNIPLTGVDKQASNGVVHTTYAIVSPPQATLKTLIAADADLSLFRAAIARADEGSTGLSRLDSLLNYPFPNITLFAPSNAAFGGLLTYLGLPVDPAVFAALPVQTVRGIVAYHFLAINGTPAVRYFSPNFVTGQYETLIGPSPMPKVTVDLSNPATPQVYGAVYLVKANFVKTDTHGVNGVMHKIDQVLLPQLP